MLGDVMWFDKAGLNDLVFVDPTFISRYFITSLITCHLNGVKDGFLQKKVLRLFFRVA